MLIPTQWRRRTARGVTPTSLVATEAVRSALGAVLADRAWELPAEVPGADFLAAVDRHRVAPLLAAGAVTLPDDAAARLAAAAQQERLAAVGVLGELMRALDALAGIDVMLMKGPAVAQLAYGEFTARGSGDLDLLVAPDDVPTAVRALTEAGWRQAPDGPTPAPGWAWRHLMTSYYQLALSGRADVDLHWRPLVSPGAFPPFEVLWERRTTLVLGGREVATLGPFDTFAHSAAHSAKENWCYLRSVADIHRLAAHDDVWQHPERPLTRAELTSIGIAWRSFGAPSVLPSAAAAAPRLAARRWPAVVASQAGQRHHDNAGRPPLSGTLRGLQAGGRSLARPGDLRALLGSTFLPAWQLGGLEGLEARAAIPIVVRRRFAHLWRRVYGWVRR